MAGIAVTGIGLATVLGGDRPTTWRRLLAGEALAIAPAVAVPLPAEGRPRVEQLALRVAHEALADAGYAMPLGDWGLVVGSSRAYQADLEKLLRAEVDLANFGQLWPGQLASTLAQELGITGSVHSLSTACATGNWAIARGGDLLARHPRVLVVAAEAPISPLTLAGFQQLGVLAKSQLRPFDRDRDGLVLAEGAAALVLEAKAGGYAQVLGWGCTADAGHVTRPGGDGATLALQPCLQRGGLAAAQVSLIQAHGTGTRLNDEREAAWIAAQFPHHPWVWASKGATGHALGATALIEAALASLALHHNVIPPSPGTQNPIYTRYTQRAIAQSLSVVLNLSFGFGGQNAIVALGHPHHFL
ncbi:MAG: beta-ketoacyl synthase N-terminal-like domain-containing protein [Pseudanabaenaceae cyanobacterium]